MGARGELIPRVQMQLLFEIMERGWMYKIERTFDMKKWKCCALLEDTTGYARVFPMRIAKNNGQEKND